MRYTPYLAGIGYATIFGFSFIFTRGALEHITPFHLLGLRFALAVVSLALLRLAGLVKIRVAPADIRAMLPLALFMPILYFPAETVGVQLTSASQAGIIIAIIPISVTILSALLLREHPARLQLPFVLASVSGVVLIFLMQGRGNAGIQYWGSLALLGAVLAASFYNIASRSASGRYSPFERTWVMMVTGAVVFNTVALVQHAAAGQLTRYFEPLTRVWPAILYLGILSSVVAFFFYKLFPVPYYRDPELGLCQPGHSDHHYSRRVDPGRRNILVSYPRYSGHSGGGLGDEPLRPRRCR